MQDSFHIVARESQIETKVLGSRFIGEVYHSDTVDNAQERLDAVRKREHAATHHCFAWKIGLFEDVTFKYSDDGEPSGTAGKPIYDMLEGAGVTNAIVIVTRYFGGTKLGTGGLVRAYGEAAQLALREAGKQEQFLTRRFHVTVEFTHYDRIQMLVHKLEATTLNNEFSDVVKLVISVRLSRVEAFLAAITEQTSGRGQVDEITK